MTSSKIFVLDTNVIISAVLSPRSVPRQALDLAFLLGNVLVSDSILVEIDDVLGVSQLLHLKFLWLFGSWYAKSNIKIPIE